MKDLRQKIDQIDDQIIKLFNERMSIAKNIAVQKQSEKLPIFNPTREKEVMNNVVNMADNGLERYAKVWYQSLLDISKSYQREFCYNDDTLTNTINNAIENTAKEFPFNANVAVQGIAGAYSDIASGKVFSVPKAVYFRDFNGVFNAVESGLCRYGIVPIENSSVGSVTAVYEAMQKYRYYIARSVRLRVNHCLLGKKDADINNIKEIISHEQALNQCSQFIGSLKNVKITVAENTAIAAEMVANADRSDIFAISSMDCMELYNLALMKKNVQNNDNNYTRFICISKNMEIYEGSNRISVMVSLPHSPGSLYQFISKFASLDINLLKIESRPIVGSDFEFLFFFDFSASLKNEKIVKLLQELSLTLDNFVLLGNYSEVL